MISFNIVPIGKPRMTRSDVWKERDVVMRYRAYCDELRYKSNVKGYQLGDIIEIEFYLPMPKSWSKKKRIEKLNSPHDEKPDIDNLLKGFIDAFKIEDKTVWLVKAQKRWGEEGKIVIL